jgi:dTDP-glucose pyrophosphorylase
MNSIRNFSAYACSPQTTVREVLARINATSGLFQMVVDADGRLLGTVTDGDVRRAMLHNVGLDDTAERCMHQQPVTGRVGQAEENKRRLTRLGSVRPFLPVLDESSRVVEVLVRDLSASGISHALVMAGGFGRRLGDRTRITPKPLLPVGDRPLLDHVLTALEDSGIGHVHISVHYLAAQIRAFVAGRENRADIKFIEEEQPLGTAGALAWLDGLIPGQILVVNGDVLTRVDLAALHDFHIRHGLDATVGVARHDLQVPFGVVRYDEEGLFESIEEKPRISNFIAAGVYYLGAEFSALVPRNQPMDMPELLTLGRRIGLRIGLFPIHEYWTDVGQPDDLDAADRLHATVPTMHGTGKRDGAP